MRSRNGATGTFCVSFGTEFKSVFAAEVVTTKGRVSVTPISVTTVTKDGEGKQKEESRTFKASDGVKEEMVAFADGLVNGKWDPKQAASEALRDLDALQSLLVSGEQGGVVIELPSKESATVLQ
jgi:predicted dehydrogenase